MKKKLTAIIVFLTVFFVVSAEETVKSDKKEPYVTGYNGIKFGATVDEVREKYPNLYLIENANEKSNISIYISGDDINYNYEKKITRFFKFVNIDLLGVLGEKKELLYEVVVNYQNYNTLYINEVKRKIASESKGEWHTFDSNTVYSDVISQELLWFWFDSVKKYINPTDIETFSNLNPNPEDFSVYWRQNMVMLYSKELKNIYGAKVGILNQFIYTNPPLQFFVKSDVEL